MINQDLLITRFYNIYLVNIDIFTWSRINKSYLTLFNEFIFLIYLQKNNLSDYLKMVGNTYLPRSYRDGEDGQSNEYSL